MWWSGASASHLPLLCFDKSHQFSGVTRFQRSGGHNFFAPKARKIFWMWAWSILIFRYWIMFFYVWRLYRSFAKNLNVYINFNFLLKSTSINVFTALSMSKFGSTSMRSSKQFAFCQSRTVNAIVMQIDEIVRIFGEYSVKFYLALAKFRGGTCPPRPPPGYAPDQLCQYLLCIAELAETLT